MVYPDSLHIDMCKMNQVLVFYEPSDNYLIALPRWGEFTRNLPKLLALGLVSQDISGNKRIAFPLCSGGFR